MSEASIQTPLEHYWANIHHGSERLRTRLFNQAVELEHVEAKQPELRFHLASGGVLDVLVDTMGDRALVDGLIFLETSSCSYVMRGETPEQSASLYNELTQALHECWAYVRRR